MWTSSTTFDAMPNSWALKESGIIWDTSGPLTKPVLLSQIGSFWDHDHKRQFSQETDTFFGSCFFTATLEPCDLRVRLLTTRNTVFTVSGLHGSFWMTTRRKALPPSRHQRKIVTTSVRCLVFQSWANAVTHQRVVGKRDFGGFNDLYIFCCITMYLIIADHKIPSRDIVKCSPTSSRGIPGSPVKKEESLLNPKS